jgi:uncharacterized protein YbaR (Trm112 family)
VFIELTDHLRCPADHAESFLVLVPDSMEGRVVTSGRLGCPVCRAEYRIVRGIAEFGPVGLREAAASAGTPDAAAIHAFLGIDGPGGYVGLVGSAATLGPDLAPLLPGVHLVAVNPPVGILPSERLSVVRAPRLPLKSRGFRGIVVGTPEASDRAWQEAAIRAVLPGLRITGTGPVPSPAGFELLGEAAGWWVGRSATG